MPLDRQPDVIVDPRIAALSRAQAELTDQNSKRLLAHDCAEWTEDPEDGCEQCWRIAGDVTRAFRGATLCTRCRGGGMVGPEGDACPECGGSGEFDPEDE